MSFSDTFTKDKEQESLLGYDDTAFRYFATCIAFVVVLPWTYSVARSLLCPTRKKRDILLSTSKASVRTCKSADMVEKASKTKGHSKRFDGNFNCWLLQVVILAVIWSVLLFGLHSISGQSEIKAFDPFEILQISHSATKEDIKKAYRRLAKQHHPDNNPGDVIAASRFRELVRAENALLDDTARRNYEKYGNPEGTQTSKVGIGLPRFLLDKDTQPVILSIFFFFLLFVVPMTFICYYQRTKSYAANGVMIETLQFLGFYINESTRVKNCPELLASSAESRSMTQRPTDNNAMKPLGQQVVEHKPRQFQSHPIIMKNSFLIWGHMQRLHHLMTTELRADCDQLLRYSMKITQAMIEIACMREWFFTAQALIDFRRSLVQGIDVKGAQLLQVPHFTEETLKACGRGKNPCTTLSDFLAKDADQRKGLTRIEDEEQLLDIEAFVAHVGDIEIKVKVEVEGESEIVAGDIATLIVQLQRKNISDDERLGPVHAPLFPDDKYEEWWVFLVEGAPSPRIICHERMRDTDRVIEARMRWQISRPGKHKMHLHALCDSYAGIDKKVEVNFTAFHPDEVKREIFVHKEDEDLDLQPTLFQQFMGDFGREEESEEEEEDTKKPAQKDLGSNRIVNAGSKAETDEDSEKKGDGDDSSASSSDSDSD